MIRFDHLAKQYPGGREAISGLDLEISAGEMVFITGHSGAGKTTLLRMIALLERPTRGQLLFDGRNMVGITGRQIAYHRRRIGMIFQDHKLLSDRSVFDNVALPLQISGCRDAELRKRVQASLDLVGLLHREKANPTHLSSGEQQRVGIARAFVRRPPVILADEPTGNLDPGLSSDIMTLFSKLNEIGMTLMIASHDLHLVRALRKRVVVLENGRLLDDIPAGQAVPDSLGKIP